MSKPEKKMPLAYVAGPYRAHNGWGVHQNIRRAEAVALELWQMGFAVICPHKNTEFFDGVCLDNVWLDGDLEMIRRCDLIVMMEGWEMSFGSKTEHSEALAHNIYVFYHPADLEKIKNFVMQAQGN